MAEKKILLAYDGSKNSDKALDWTINFAGQISAVTYVAGVIDAAIDNVGKGFNTVTKAADREFTDEAVSRLKEAAAKFEKENLPAKMVTLAGDPAAALIEYAEKEEPYLVICGGRSKGALNEIVLGSVATKLVANCPAPVAVIK